MESSVTVVKVISIYEFADGSYDMSVHLPGPEEAVRFTKADADVIYDAMQEQLYGS